MKPLNKLISMFAVVAMVLSSCEGEDQLQSENTLPDLRSMSVQELEVIEAANNFSMDILASINAGHATENIFISPFSISAALSMTANGAKGETREAIKRVLHTSHLSDQEMNEAYRDLVKYLLELDKKTDLQIANSNWYTHKLNIKPDFKSVLRDYYDAEVKAADFDDPATLDLINGWIENKTRGKIKDMLDLIEPDAIMYLINAIYFKSEWKYTFEKNLTSKKAFYTSSGEKQVDMMHSKGVKLARFYHEDFALADLPYGNGQYSMTVLVSNRDKDINDIIAGLDAEKLDDFINQADTATMEVYFPKFTMEFKKELSNVLADIGMGLAFTRYADFKGLFQDELERVAISRVLHQSFIEVNEKGSEAAAATIVEMIIMPISLLPPLGPPIFNVNRPFVFFIREKHSNTILFAGKMLDPS
ncbi:MAG: serpin family protein [Cyclobacteriaceae bacterium]